MNQSQYNNIIFKIAASDAISNFKLAQAHSLMQISRGELKFDNGAKEALLLEYECYSDRLLKTEKSYIVRNAKNFTAAIKKLTLKYIVDEMNHVQKIIDINPETFSRELADFIRLIHGYSLDIFDKWLEKQIGASIANTFSAFSAILTQHLQHLLISLHEFNNNIVTKEVTPFLSIADFSLININETTKFSMLYKRASFFKNLGIITPFILKNYSCDRFIFDAAQDYLSKFDIKLLPESEYL